MAQRRRFCATKAINKYNVAAIQQSDFNAFMKLKLESISCVKADMRLVHTRRDSKLMVSSQMLVSNNEAIIASYSSDTQYALARDSPVMPRLTRHL